MRYLLQLLSELRDFGQCGKCQLFTGSRDGTSVCVGGDKALAAHLLSECMWSLFPRLQPQQVVSQRRRPQPHIARWMLHDVRFYNNSRLVFEMLTLTLWRPALQPTFVTQVSKLGHLTRRKRIL